MTILAYIVLLVPYSVTQLFMLSGFPVPFEALVFACVCWFMIGGSLISRFMLFRHQVYLYDTGIANVGLLYNVFRVLGPVIDVRSNNSMHSSRASSGKGFFDSEKYQISAQEIKSQSQSTVSYHRSSASMGSVQTHSQVNPSTDYIVPFRTHSRSDSDNSPRIGRSISPALHLSRSISTQPRGLGIIPEQTPYNYPQTPPSSGSASKPSLTMATHLRHAPQRSVDSIGLPAAPRVSRSEVARGHHHYSPSSPASTRSNATRYAGVLSSPSPTGSGRSLTSPVSLAQPSAAVTRQAMSRDSFGAPSSPSSGTGVIIDAYASSGYPRSSYFETYYGQGPPSRGHSSSSSGNSATGYGGMRS